VGFEPTVPCDTTVFELDCGLRTVSCRIPDRAVEQGTCGCTFADRLSDSDAFSQFVRDVMAEIAPCPRRRTRREAQLPTLTM